jgi:hypothetical protein
MTFIPAKVVAVGGKGIEFVAGRDVTVQRLAVKLGEHVYLRSTTRKKNGKERP